MPKLTRILTIVAVALVASSLFALLVTYPFQGLLVTGLPDYYRSALPIFPLAEVVVTCLKLTFVALLLICAFCKKGGIWLEVVIFACLLLVIPTVSTMATTMSYQLLVNVRGEMYYAAYTITNSLRQYCCLPASWGVAIAYAVCGMSMVTMRMAKKAVAD